MDGRMVGWFVGWLVGVLVTFQFRLQFSARRQVTTEAKLAFFLIRLFVRVCVYPTNIGITGASPMATPLVVS